MVIFNEIFDSYRIKQGNIEAAKKLLDEEGFYVLDKEKVDQLVEDVKNNNYISKNAKDHMLVAMETLFLASV